VTGRHAPLLLGSVLSPASPVALAAGATPPPAMATAANE